MSTKSLTKSAWESLAKKHGLDEKPLSKPLTAFERCAEDDYEAQQEALAALQKAAEGLKKDKAYAKAADYLGEVIDAAKSEIKAVAAKAKEDEGGEEEAAEYRKDLPKQIKGALARVKALAPTDPPPPPGSETPQMKFVAYLAGSSCAVVIGKKAGNAAKKLVASLSGASGGKYFSGECIFEKSAYTFVVEQMAGGLAQKLAGALLEESGKKYKVRVRTAGGEAEEAGGEGEESEQEASEGEEPGAPPVDVIGRLKALKPDLDKVLAAGAPDSAAIRTKFVETANLAKQQSPQAAGSLAELEKSLAEALASLGGPKVEPKREDALASFKTRFATLVPKIKEAIAAGGPSAAALKEKTALASTQAKAGNLEAASATLDEIEALLAAPPTPSPAEQMAAFTARLKAMMPEIAKAVADGLPAGAGARTKAAAAGAAAKAGDFAGAGALLDEVASLLAQKPPKVSEADWLAAMDKTGVVYLRVIKTVPEEGTKMRALWALAQEQAEAANYETALKTLGQLDTLLGGAGKTEIDGIPAGLVHYRSALLAFAQAKNDAARQIAALQAAIPSAIPEEKDLAKAVAEYLSNWNDAVGNTVDAAINKSKDERQPYEEATRKAVAAYLQDLNSNALIAHADANPVSPVNLRSTIGGALRLIEMTLAKL